MKHVRRALRSALPPTALAGALLVAPFGTEPALGQGVGDASWTPARSTTVARSSSFLVPGDSIVYVTDAAWDRSQVDGLATYAADGLRYTHEVNDRSGRLSATGFWATNHPDPAYDRDDDDEDGRWEEAEITAGAELPVPGATYTTLLEFSRWHGKRQGGRCRWAWDRRTGSSEVLSQLSRELFGEWQALRYTLGYLLLEYPRVGTRPDPPSDAPSPACRERRPRPSEAGVVVTFREPLRWPAFRRLGEGGTGGWTAFEAVGTREQDAMTWTCGGPVLQAKKLKPCRAFGIRPAGVSAAIGYFDEEGIGRLREDQSVARVDALRDGVTGLLQDVGGLGVEPPGLTIDDAYWELFLAD